MNTSAAATDQVDLEATGRGSHHSRMDRVGRRLRVGVAVMVLGAREITMDRLTTLRSTTAADDHAAHDSPRRVRKTLFAIAMSVSALAVSLVSAAPASAATGRIGQYTSPQCGYYLQDIGNLSDNRMTVAFLPSVTGTTTTSQRVWVHVQFVYAANGAVYADEWFYTTAVAGRWTTTWTTYSTGSTGQTAVHDSGQSGFVYDAAKDVNVLETMTWMTGSTETGWQAQWAYSPRSTQNHSVCNGGGYLFRLP